MARRIEVEIVGDSRSVERAFAKSARSATVFEARMRGVSRGLSTGFKTLAGAVGIAFTFDALVRGLEDSVNAAEDLNKEVSKTRIVFGGAARSVEDWAKTTANALGINEAEALQAASNFGILFDRLGKGRDVSAEMSKQLVQVAGDLASFFHISSSDVLTKLLRGLYGQARGVKVLGINMTAARVQAEAYRDGIAKQGTALTENQKVQARYNIILRDTAQAQGNALAHSKDWANVSARLKAQLEDTAAAIGQTLLPMLKKYGDKLAKWLAEPKNQKEIADDAATAFNAFAGAVNAVAAAFEAFHNASKWFDRNKLSFLNKGAKQDIEDLNDWLGKHGLGWTKRIPIPKGPSLLDLFGGGGGGGARGPGVGGLAAAIKQAAQAITATAGPLGRPRGGLITGPGGLSRAQIERRKEQAFGFFDARIARQLDRVQDLSSRKQLVRLGQIAAEIKGRLAVTKDVTRRMTLEDQLLNIYRQQRSVQQDITDQIKEANQALKDRAEAIKSAILDRLQRKQTDVENKRALEDARKQLRLALALGGPHGILVARRAVSDALMAQRIAAAERARPTLTRGGQFALGNIVTVNIHGVTDPDKVARAVIAAMNRRGRRTTSQSRGPQAGAPAGAH